MAGQDVRPWLRYRQTWANFGHFTMTDCYCSPDILLPYYPACHSLTDRLVMKKIKREQFG